GNAIFPQDSFSQDSKCHLPFENESFEVVTMLAVLEHLNHPLDMLKQITRVLKPNGVLILTVPSHLAKPVLEFLAFKLKIVSEAEIRDHKTYYNKKDLHHLIAQIPSLHLKTNKYFQRGMNNLAIVSKA
ncbi:class I SAM-dependent methyltransferase, partial [Helicobacter cinaedi]